MALMPEEIEEFRRLIMTIYRIDEFMEEMASDGRSEFAVPRAIPLANGDLMLLDPAINRPFAVVVSWDKYSEAVAVVNPMQRWREVAGATGRVEVPGEGRRKNRGGRPPLAPDVIEKIYALARKHPDHGGLLIQKELATKHGIVLGRTTIDRYLARWRRGGGR